MDLEKVRKKGSLEGAISAISRAPEDDEGKIMVSKDGILEILQDGIDAVKDLEEIEERVERESKESQ